MEELLLHHLPPEVLLHIASFLNLQDLLACSRTCSYLRAVLNDNVLWRRHYRGAIVDYLQTAASLVEPGFTYHHEEETLEHFCEERVNLLRQNHLLDNWRKGRSVNHESQTPGNGLFLENNDRQIIYDNVYLFLHVLNTNEINVWNIEEVPVLYTSVVFSLHDYNMEDEDWNDIMRVWYQVVGNKLIVFQGNLVQIFKINLPDKSLPLEHLVSVDREAPVDSFVETLYTDCYSWVVGHLLFSRLCYLPVVHVWDILTGRKKKILRAPTTGWDLYVISMDDMENIVLSLRTDDPFAAGPEDFTKIVNHISSYSVSRDEFTTLYPSLAGCKPVHALHHEGLIVMFCIDDMFVFRCSIYVYDLLAGTTVAHRVFPDLVGLYKSRIVDNRLVLATQSSVEVLDVTTLQPLSSLKMDDIIDIDYLPVFGFTFIIMSSVKNDMEVWDVNRNDILLKIPLQSYVFLNESCTKLIMISGQKLTVKNFW